MHERSAAQKIMTNLYNLSAIEVYSTSKDKIKRSAFFLEIKKTLILEWNYCKFGM